MTARRFAALFFIFLFVSAAAGLGQEREKLKVSTLFIATIPCN